MRDGTGRPFMNQLVELAFTVLIDQPDGGTTRPDPEAAPHFDDIGIVNGGRRLRPFFRLAHRGGGV